MVSWSQTRNQKSTSRNVALIYGSIWWKIRSQCYRWEDCAMSLVILFRGRQEKLPDSQKVRKWWNAASKTSSQWWQWPNKKQYHPLNPKTSAGALGSWSHIWSDQGDSTGVLATHRRTSCGHARTWKYHTLTAQNTFLFPRMQSQFVPQQFQLTSAFCVQHTVVQVSLLCACVAQPFQRLCN